MGPEWADSVLDDFYVMTDEANNTRALQSTGGDSAFPYTCYSRPPSLDRGPHRRPPFQKRGGANCITIKILLDDVPL